MNHPNRNKLSVTVTYEGPYKYVVRVNGELHSQHGEEFTARQDAGRLYAANLKIRTRLAYGYSKSA